MAAHKIFETERFVLDEGETLGTATLAYQTYGTLNAARDNVIVYPTWFPAQHQDNEWLIGPGKVLDPERYFIVVPTPSVMGCPPPPATQRSHKTERGFRT